MTTAVLAPLLTKTKRREPLGTIAMAASQAQSRLTPASGGAGKGRGESRTTRNSKNKQGLEEPINDGKRKADYEEDADGFQFSIVPSKKKPRPSLEAVPEVPQSNVENAPPKSTPRRGRPPKKRVGEKASASAVPVKRQTTELPSRRPTRGTAKGADTEQEPQPESATRSLPTREPREDQLEEKKRKRGRPGRPKSTEQNGLRSPDQPSAGTKIALPVADTPVMQRNKELRGGKSDKGRRRSSLGLRGRRASSLIDTGASNALPHREVNTADFYKHIADNGLPEPRRMRQLLIWCATRAIGDKRLGSQSDDQSARLAARAIQEELLKEFSSNSELSNWFSREDVNPPTMIVKKPNPRNVQNTDKIKDLEEQIQKLQKERHALNALSKQPAIPRISETDQPKSERYPNEYSPNQIDLSLLDPHQQSILASLDPSPKAQQPDDASSPSTIRPPMSPSTVSSRLSRITTGLAPTLDTFAAGIHDIEMYRTTADAVSARILRTCAQRLEERDAFNTQQRLAIEGDGDDDDDEQRPPSQRVERPRQDIGVILGALSRLERR